MTGKDYFLNASVALMGLTTTNTPHKPLRFKLYQIQKTTKPKNSTLYYTV
jgi:hypothetical protein